MSPSLPIPPTPSHGQPGALTLAPAFLPQLPSLLFLGLTHRLTGHLVMGLHPVFRAGCLRIVASFPRMPVLEAWTSPRLHHIYLPALGCPCLLSLCEPWTALPSWQWLPGCLAGTQPLSLHGPGRACTHSFTLAVMWHQSYPLEAVSQE